MTTPSRRRLMRDFKKLQEDPPAGVSGAPTEDNILAWEAVIFGPQDTPFEDGTFKLTLEFTEEYPNKPPVVKFVSRMFHPNVYADGSICLDILQNRWSPTYDVAAILTSIQSLLDEPNPNSPANSHAAQLYQVNILAWEAVIFGPQDTPFEDGTFKLTLEFTEEYPNKPPVVKFVSRMFHPNVYADGSICLDILQNRWSPTYDVAAILTSIQSLLDEPNPNSPANSHAAQLYQENRREYEKRVQQIVEQSWLNFGEAEGDLEMETKDGMDVDEAALPTTASNNDGEEDTAAPSGSRT